MTTEAATREKRQQREIRRRDRIASNLRRLADDEDSVAYIARLLGRGKYEMGDEGSNDGEHDVLAELIDVLDDPRTEES